MQTITKIGRQKNNTERYNIYLNEQYAFAVDENTLIKYDLQKGKILEQLEIDEIQYDDEIAKAFNKGLNFLSYQMRSEFEVRTKLVAAGHGEAVVQEALHKLTKLGFLNDESYSKALLETRKRTAKKGPAAIRQDLTKKGIDKNLQQQVLATFELEEQVKIAMELAEKAVRTNSNKTPVQIKQKIQDILLRKGYSYTVVTEILGQLTLEREVDEWDSLMEEQGDKIWRKFSSKYAGYELKNKVKQALYQKGFPLDVINQYIEQKGLEQHE